MASPEELDYNEEVSESPTTMLQNDLKCSPDSDVDAHKKQGWSVNKRGVYHCRVPECNKPAYQSTACLKRHWNAKHVKYLQRFRCCKKDCQMINEHLWRVKSHAEKSHQRRVVR